MNWFETLALVIMLLGLGAGAFLVAQRPSFWIGIGKAAITAALPAIIKVVSRRMTPAQEQAYQDCLRSGGDWDFARKKCRR